MADQQQECQICLCEDRQRGLLELLLPEDLQRANPPLLSPLLRRGPPLQRVLGGERPRDRLRGNRRQSFCLQLRKRLLCRGHCRLLVHLGRWGLAVQHKHTSRDLLIMSCMIYGVINNQNKPPIKKKKKKKKKKKTPPKEKKKKKKKKKK